MRPGQLRGNLAAKARERPITCDEATPGACGATGRRRSSLARWASKISFASVDSIFRFGTIRDPAQPEHSAGGEVQASRQAAFNGSFTGLGVSFSL